MDNRTVQFHFFATLGEAKLIRDREKEIGILNESAYLRKMAIDGYLIQMDLSDVKEAVRLLGITSANMNQYAKKANETGRGRLFEYNGKLYRSPKALAEEYGLPWNSLAHYIQRCKTVEEAVDRCKEAQEKKIMLWGKRYQSRYEVATAFGIRETSISARIHTRNRTLEEIVLELLQKEPICFEGKTYNTLVELCAEYQVQPCNVFERLKYGKTLEEAIYLPIRNNGKRYEIEYEGKVYQNAAFLCREYNISKLLVYGQQRYKSEYSFIECFHLVKQLRDECGWPKTEVFAFIPRCKIQGKFYKRISDFASAVGMTRGQIDTYKSRHHHKNMIEALQEMKKDRIPAYKTECGLLPYSEARKKKYTSKQLEQLAYVPSALPRYPVLQSFDFTQDSMDILLRYEELFQKQSQCKREWREQR